MLLKPPFRADHIGSLKRPAYLLEKRVQADKTEDELRAAEVKAITDIVAMQREVGIRSYTDGEFTRSVTS